MEIVLFTLNAIVVYVVSDWIVRAIERRRGAVMEQRQAVFFVVFLVLILVSFQMLRHLRAGATPVHDVDSVSDVEGAVQPRIEGGEVPQEPVAQTLFQLAAE